MRKLLLTLLLTISVATMVGCTKEEVEKALTEGTTTTQEQAQKPQENKVEETVKLESWESSKINETTAEAYFYENIKELHTFKSETSEEYLVFLKSVVADHRYPLFEKLVKEVFIPQKLVYEHIDSKVTGFKKTQFKRDGGIVYGYDISYDVTFKKNGVQETEKCIATLEIKDNTFRINDFWREVK